MSEPPRARNRAGEGSRLRHELIDAAARVLAATPDGADLSLRAVAREAGVAAPSVYLQFANKAALLQAVWDSSFDQLRTAIEAAVALHADPALRLQAGCFAYCRFGQEHPGVYRILFEHRFPRSEALGPFGSASEAGPRALATLVDAITACIAVGIAPANDPFRLATQLWSAMHGYVVLVRLRPDFPWLSMEDHVNDLIVALVGVPHFRPPAAAPDATAQSDASHAPSGTHTVHCHQNAGPGQDADGGTL